jgi:hypothetical protein
MRFWREPSTLTVYLMTAWTMGRSFARFVIFLSEGTDEAFREILSRHTALVCPRSFQSSNKQSLSVVSQCRNGR